MIGTGAQTADLASSSRTAPRGTSTCTARGHRRRRPPRVRARRDARAAYDPATGTLYTAGPTAAR
ncbi:hypothetical protein QJS66_15520 [Kocuria rhizophila]|nr:hypothetical protein QJS66_15520 [Kocuria rhizophila]